MLTKFHINPDDEIKMQIAHCLKNIIDLDGLFFEKGLHHKKSIFQRIFEDYQTDKRSFKGTITSHNEID